jgi:hypothetical protein
MYIRFTLVISASFTLGISREKRAKGEKNIWTASIPLTFKNPFENPSVNIVIQEGNVPRKNKTE